MHNASSIEPGLIRIFRFFVIAETIAFLMVPLSQWLISGSYQEFYLDSYYYIFLQALVLSIYLSIPWLQRKMKKAYLFVAVLIAIIIPTFIVNLNLMIEVSQEGLPDMLKIWSLMPLLMIPLVPAAWQYDFKTVFLLFGGLGVLESLFLVFVRGGLSPDMLMPLFATFIRVITLCLVGFMITELIQTQREQRRRLMRANLQLSKQALVQEQLATSRERNRLARELHDTLAHTLSGLTVQLEAIHTVMPENANPVDEMVEKALETSRKGLEDTRRALKALRAEPLEDLGLIFAIQDLAEKFSKRTQLKINTEFPEKITTLTLDEEQAIYRVVQEALTNIDRHAKASEVVIQLKRDDNRWLLLVRDDGLGFSANEVDLTENLGIKGMYERALTVGGDLKVNSEIGKGTEVILTLEEKA